MHIRRGDFTRTSKTLREILKGPDCPERQHAVSELAQIYQPVWEATAKHIMRRYGNKNATLDASDVVGDEIAKMLSPGGDYFNTYDEAKSLRGWVKACIRHRAIDLLRRRRTSELPQDGPAMELTTIVEVLETYELFRRALAIADDLSKLRGNQEDMAIFRAVRSAQDRLPPEERRKRGWTEWQERTAVSRVWELIRDEAIPAAASVVSDSPDDAAEAAKELWGRIRTLKAIDLPETWAADDGAPDTGTKADEQMD